jgi:hypothetical protein
LYGIDVRLKYTTVVWRSDSAEDFDVISKKKIPGMLNGSAQVVNEYIESRGPKTDACGTTDG